MGQGISNQACCSSFCAPEDPLAEQKKELDSKANSPYPLISSEHTPGSPTPSAVAATALPPPIYGGGQEEQEAFCIPPPPASGVQEPLAAQMMPPVVAASSASKASANPATGSASSPGAPAEANKLNLSFEAVVMDLEASELAEYGAHFAKIAGSSGSVQPDNDGLRDFVATNSAITLDDIDTELLKVASLNNEFSIDCDGFLSLIRDNSILETDALEQFLNLNSNGESITAEDCRSGLLCLAETKLAASLTSAQLEKIFDTVMIDVGLNVSMEQWINCCKRVARIVRLLRCARI